jgi:hypothetical protein
MDLRLDSAAKQQEPTSEQVTAAAKKIRDLHARVKLHISKGGYRILDSNELADAKSLVPKLEIFDDRLGLYFFSINGVLNGEPFQGALFAGEMMAVEARTHTEAKHTAAAGLADTINALHEEYFTRAQRELQDQGVEIDVAGGKVREGSKPLPESFQLMLKDSLKAKN